jgi:hypothetical protein
MDDIDAAVTYRREQLRSLRPQSKAPSPISMDLELTNYPELGSTPEGISIEYHFRLAHFCLSTHLILSITASNIDPSALHTVHRCVDLAMDVLNLSHNIGPIGKEAFRFQPGFVFVSLSFCIAFVLQAIQAFPDQFSNTQFIFMVIKRIGSMMTDSSVDQTHDCGAAGRANLRQLRITMDALRNRRLGEQERIADQSRQRTVPPTEHTTAPPTESETQESLAAHQVPWTGTTDSFPTTFMEDVNGFDYEQMVLDPAFTFPDFFNYAPQITS